MANKSTIVFRADGNAQIGWGHVMRSLALADMLKSDFDCRFATRFVTPYLNTEIEKSGAVLHELPLNDEAHFEAFMTMLTGQEVVVLDNYFFTTRHQQQIKQKGCKLVCIDDLADKEFVADVIINHSPGALPQNYSAKPSAKLCLGFDYLLLRKPFIEALANNQCGSNRQPSILISFGGSDPLNLTNKVVNEVLQSGFAGNITAVVSSQFSAKPQLYKQVEKSDGQLTVYENLDATQLANLFCTHQTAIVPFSTMLFEAIACGCNIVTGAYVDNQAAIERYVKSNGLLITHNFLTEKVNLPLLQQAHKYPNPLSHNVPHNFIKVFDRLALSQQSVLRPMNQHDLMTVFNWANDPEVRKYAFNPEPISLETHTNWFNSKLQSNHTHLFMMETNGQPAGQIRFDYRENEWVISYLLDSTFRGKGLGKTLIEKGIEALRAKHPGPLTITGFVLNENKASKKTFIDGGFDEQFDIQHNAFKYTLNYA
jgi:UDP-2,4-diacetamido-2,4,6-trideoxy-beta-L-altropyranose hydrolase